MKKVKIDCFPESARHYGRDYAVVAVDVIRATTSAVTLAALGWKTYVAGTLDHALELASGLDDPLLVGELGGNMPEGFHMNNSPAELEERCEFHRPVVLLSTSGTRLVHEASGAAAVYMACFRNYSYTAAYLAGQFENIAVIGAGSRGEFREEDQMGCAWIAGQLVEAGYRPADDRTSEIIECWRGVPPAACWLGNSAAYLRRSGQARDLDYILKHIDDFAGAVTMRENQLIVESQATISREVSAFAD